MKVFGLGLPELIIILVVVLILFGPKRLPQIGQSLGKTLKAVRDGVEGKDEVEAEPPAPAPAAKPAESPAPAETEKKPDERDQSAGKDA